MNTPLILYAGFILINIAAIILVTFNMKKIEKILFD